MIYTHEGAEAAGVDQRVDVANGEQRTFVRQLDSPLVLAFFRQSIAAWMIGKPVRSSSTSAATASSSGRRQRRRPGLEFSATGDPTDDYHLLWDDFFAALDMPDAVRLTLLPVAGTLSSITSTSIFPPLWCAGRLPSPTWTWIWRKRASRASCTTSRLVLLFSRTLPIASSFTTRPSIAPGSTKSISGLASLSVNYSNEALFLLLTNSKPTFLPSSTITTLLWPNPTNGPTRANHS